MERDGDVVGEVRIASGLVVWTTNSRGGIEAQAAALELDQLEEVARDLTSRRSVRIAIDEAVRLATESARQGDGRQCIDVTRRLEDGRRIRIRSGVVLHVLGVDDSDDSDTCECMGASFDVESMAEWWGPRGGAFDGEQDFDPPMRAALDGALQEAEVQERDVFESPVLRMPDGTAAADASVDLDAIEEAVRRGARSGAVMVDAAVLAAILAELRRGRRAPCDPD